MVANLTDPYEEGPGKGGSRGLYSLFWQLRGDMCGVRTDFRWRFCHSALVLGLAQSMQNTLLTENKNGAHMVHP